jgi:hypothetical protein
MCTERKSEYQEDISAKYRERGQEEVFGTAGFNIESKETRSLTLQGLSYDFQFSSDIHTSS